MRVCKDNAFAALTVPGLLVLAKSHLTDGGLQVAAVPHQPPACLQHSRSPGHASPRAGSKATACHTQAEQGVET